MHMNVKSLLCVEVRAVGDAYTYMHIYICVFIYSLYMCIYLFSVYVYHDVLMYTRVCTHFS
jgi:hypothetical protein